MQENVTAVTQEMQHLCLTAERRAAPLSGLLNLRLLLGGKIYDFSPRCDGLRALGAAITRISVRIRGSICQTDAESAMQTKQRLGHSEFITVDRCLSC